MLNKSVDTDLAQIFQTAFGGSSAVVDVTTLLLRLQCMRNDEKNDLQELLVKTSRLLVDSANIVRDYNKEIPEHRREAWVNAKNEWNVIFYRFYKLVARYGNSSKEDYTFMERLKGKRANDRAGIKSDAEELAEEAFNNQLKVKSISTHGESFKRGLAELGLGFGRDNSSSITISTTFSHVDYSDSEAINGGTEADTMFVRLTRLMAAAAAVFETFPSPNGVSGGSNTLPERAETILNVAEEAISSVSNSVPPNRISMAPSSTKQAEDSLRSIPNETLNASGDNDIPMVPVIMDLDLDVD